VELRKMNAPTTETDPVRVNRVSLNNANRSGSKVECGPLPLKAALTLAYFLHSRRTIKKSIIL
jgi:hypothetical protein